MERVSTAGLSLCFLDPKTALPNSKTNPSAGAFAFFD